MYGRHRLGWRLAARLAGPALPIIKKMKKIKKIKKTIGRKPSHPALLILPAPSHQPPGWGLESKAGGWRLEAGRWRLEAGGRRLDAGGEKAGRVSGLSFP